MEKAKMLLKTTDIYVNEVGVRVGYPDIFHFSKAFKKYAGYSPVEFRRLTYLQ
jgi:YesN/AraC family two-component response regulator